jgi:uncharacterized protein (DUF3820 family)
MSDTENVEIQKPALRRSKTAKTTRTKKKKVVKPASDDEESSDDDDEKEEPVKKTYLERMAEFLRRDNPYHEVTGSTLSDLIMDIYHFQEMENEKKKQESNKFPFGKYKGKTVVSVVVFDKQYCRWLLKQDMMENYVELSESIRSALLK